jgi:hypothetical protein
LNTALFTEICFPNDPVVLSVGGISPDQKNQQQFGQLGALDIFSRILEQQEIDSLINHSFYSPALFRCQDACDLSTDSQIIIQVPEFSDLTLTINNPPHTPKPLLYWMIYENDHLLSNSPHFDSQEYFPRIVAVVGQLFQLSEQCQLRFSGLGILLDALHDHPKCLSSKLYFAICRVLENISLPSLRQEWFSELILSLPLWTKLEFQEFKQILNHWTHILIGKFPQECRATSLSKLINQYFIFFAYTDEGISSGGFIHVSEFRFPAKLLNDSYRLTDIDQCGDNFLLFLARLAIVAIKGSDADSIVIHLVDWKSKRTLLKLFHFLYSISPIIVKVPELLHHRYFTLHKFLSHDDVDIVETALLLIQEIYQNDAHLHMIFAGYQFTKHSFPRAIFDRLLIRLLEFPRLLILLCVLALRLDQSAIKSLATTLIGFSKNPEAASRAGGHRTWFVWPLLVGIHADVTERSHVANFIAVVLIQQPTIFERVFSRISSFLTFLTSVTTGDILGLYEQLIRSISILAKDLTIQIVQIVFAATFFHATSRTHNQHLIKLVHELISCEEIEKEIPENQPPLPKVGDFKSLQEMIDLYPHAQLHFSLNFNENKEWIEQPIAIVASAICENASEAIADRSFGQILRYFCDRNGFSPKERFEVMKSTNEVVSTLGPVIQHNFAEDLKELFSSMKSDFDKMLDMISISPDYQSGGSQTLLESESVFCIYHPTRRPNSIEYETDPTYCTHFCPQKIRKVTPQSPFSELPRFLNDCILEKVGNIIDLQHVTSNVTFRLYKDFIILQDRIRTRAIPTNTITHNWPRTTRNSGIEIVTDSGISILFDFLTIDVTTLIKTFKKANFEKFVLWPVADLFTQLKCCEKWISGEISNFDYIIYLNFLSGRSFRDSSAYPFFPSLLSDFDTFKPILSSKSKLKVDPNSKIRIAFIEPIVPAHFFFSIERIDEIPIWANSAADFIDKMRLLLESPAISDGLHAWCTMYFGQTAAASNGRLFQYSVHPEKLPFFVVIGRSCQIELPLQNAKVRVTQQVSPNCVLLVLNNGAIGRFSFASIPDFRHEFAWQGRNVAIESESMLAVGNGYVAILSQKELTFLGPEKVESRVNVGLERPLMACIGLQVVYCDSSCSVTIISTSGRRRSFCRVRSRIVALASDSIFKIVIVGTIDGFVHVYNLIDGAEIQSVSVGCETRMILITPNWGYVIILAGDIVWVLNINGLILTHVEMSEPIIQWFTFSSYGDSDCVAFLTDGGCLGHFPALHPENAKILKGIPAGIRGLLFERPSESFVLISKNGHISVIPANPN